jgi:aryl-alcohol dehydrogenase-like predicted oxidoreductase
MAHGRSRAGDTGTVAGDGTREFGRTGLRVSRLCLGTMTFGFQCDEPASAAILDELTTEYRFGDAAR